MTFWNNTKYRSSLHQLLQKIKQWQWCILNGLSEGESFFSSGIFTSRLLLNRFSRPQHRRWEGGKERHLTVKARDREKERTDFVQRVKNKNKNWRLNKKTCTWHLKSSMLPQMDGEHELSICQRLSTDLHLTHSPKQEKRLFLYTVYIYI